jgi:cellulose synthase/poly-beta-1,6-N-acetylglucosamine synthase-like glycosyltransferase
LNWSNWIRQFHRWMAVAFTLGFIVNIVAMSGGKEPAFWVYLTALIPLFLLFPTGLYMFIQPYAARWRGERQQSLKEVQQP